MFRINISLYGDEIDMLIIKWFLRTLWGTLCYNAYSDQDSYTFLGIMNNSSMPKEKELSLQDRGRPARSSVLWSWASLLQGVGVLGQRRAVVWNPSPMFCLYGGVQIFLLQVCLWKPLPFLGAMITTASNYREMRHSVIFGWEGKLIYKMFPWQCFSISLLDLQNISSVILIIYFCFFVSPTNVH